MAGTPLSWIPLSWIAVDWGTSRLRAWAMDAAGRPLTSATSERGMGTLAPEAFEGALLELIGPWLSDAPVTVVACGMVGSRQGWVEAPYAPVPCPALPSGPVRAATADPRLAVWVIPGLSQRPQADVMRGEETQIAGFLARNPGWDGVLCLPGTHSKWAHVSADEVVSFRTFLTGEMFDLLSTRSVLRHSLGAAGPVPEAAFRDAVEETLSKPEALAARLFTLRAADLLEGQRGAEPRARLSGYLIGAELAAARPYWLGQPVAIVGAPAIAALYRDALAAVGLTATLADAEAMTLAGLAAAHGALYSAPAVPSL